MDERLTLDLPDGVTRDEVRRMVDQWHALKKRGDTAATAQHCGLLVGVTMIVGIPIALTGGWTVREVFEPLTIAAAAASAGFFFIGRRRSEDASRQQTELEVRAKARGIKIERWGGYPVNAATGERIAL